MDETITCENCGRRIGKLETPRVFDEHAVCEECWERLTPTIIEPDVQPISQPVPVARVVAPPPRRVCPVCGSSAPPVRKSKGSALLMLLLLLLWVVPGIIYAFVYNGYVYVCPTCGAKLGDAV